MSWRPSLVYFWLERQLRVSLKFLVPLLGQLQSLLLILFTLVKNILLSALGRLFTGFTLVDRGGECWLWLQKITLDFLGCVVLIFGPHHEVLPILVQSHETRMDFGYFSFL